MSVSRSCRAREALAQTDGRRHGVTRNVPERDAKRIHDRWLREAGWQQPARKAQARKSAKPRSRAIGIRVTVKPKRNKNA
jgi:hypothetical protein